MNDAVLEIVFSVTLFSYYAAKLSVVCPQMGRVFITHVAGSRLVVCAHCTAPLTSLDQRHSANFVSSSGPAWLFNHVANLTYSAPYVRMMITGRHFVNDVSCKRCGAHLGWKYEYAFEDPQTYKEGKIILECAAFLELVNNVDPELSAGERIC